MIDIVDIMELALQFKANAITNIIELPTLTEQTRLIHFCFFFWATCYRNKSLVNFHRPDVEFAVPTTIAPRLIQSRLYA